MHPGPLVPSTTPVPPDRHIPTRVAAVGDPESNGDMVDVQQTRGGRYRSWGPPRLWGLTRLPSEDRGVGSRGPSGPHHPLEDPGVRVPSGGFK